MAEFPAMPFYTDAYLADTRHLTTIEHGAYVLLLITAWRNGGSLPNDDKLLARYAALGPRQWQRIKPSIMQFFHEENGSLYNGKLSDTLVAVRTKSKKASDSARAKYRKNKETGSANAQRSLCESPATKTKTKALPKGKDEFPPNGGAEKTAHQALTDTVWRVCPGKLTSLGMRENQARSFIGKCLKGAKPADVLEAIDSASKNGTKEPVAYVTKALRSESQSDERKRFEERMRQIQ